MKLLPQPKKVILKRRTLEISHDIGCTISDLMNTDHILYKTIEQELNLKQDASNKIVNFKNNKEYRKETELKSFLADEEGYILEINEDGIFSYALTEKGHFYSMMTLKQLFNEYGNVLPQLIIGDKPTIKLRGQQIPFGQANTKFRMQYMEYLIPKLAMWKVNMLYIYIETFFEFPSLPHVAAAGAMTKKEAIELNNLCKKYNIKLVPQLNFMGHNGDILATEKYHNDLIECPADEDKRVCKEYNFCVTSPKVDNLVDMMLYDIMDIFDSNIVHIGGDEVSTFAECPTCKMQKQRLGEFKLYIKYINRIKDNVNSRGKLIGIWGDMLNKYFNEFDPQEQRKFADSLKDGVIIYDWNYDGGSYSTLERFKNLGFKVVACSAPKLCQYGFVELPHSDKQLELFKDAVNLNIEGGLTTGWCNFVGSHEELGHYFFANGASYLWSGKLVDDFDKVYDFQRYGLKNAKMCKFLRMFSDKKGEVTKILNSKCTINIRKSILHSDNVFKFFMFYSKDLIKDDAVVKYESAIMKARVLWEEIEGLLDDKDIYSRIQIMPLILNEFALKRYIMIEKMYTAYHNAALAQFKNNEQFRADLSIAQSEILEHFKDFNVIENYIKILYKYCGVEKMTVYRLQRTKEKMDDLVNFLEYLKESQKLIPSLAEIMNVFMERHIESNWEINRVSDWEERPNCFKKYGTITKQWN